MTRLENPLLAKVRAEGNPIVEGNLATFIWQGAHAPLLIEDVHNWDESPQKMKRAGSELWSFSLQLPEDAYLEYAFLDTNSGKRIPDPFNSKSIWNGIDEFNHYFYMPNAVPSLLVRRDKNLAQGLVSKHKVATHDLGTDAQRQVFLYQPAVKFPVPLLVVFDGQDYLGRAKMNIIVDNLVSKKQIQPIAIAFIKNGGQSRTIEYSCSEATLGLLMERILPLAKEHLNLEPVEKGNFGILGASLGGLMAFFTALRLPHIFRNVLSQSGAFITPEYQSIVVDMIRLFPTLDLNIWMDAGRLEWLLEGNQQMFALLKDKKYNVEFHEFSAGHNYTAWRNDLWRGLEWLYGNKE